MMVNNNEMETRTFMDELLTKGNSPLFDLGHPLLNRVADSFVKAAEVELTNKNLVLQVLTQSCEVIGALQAVSRDAYFTAVEGAGVDTAGVSPKNRRFPDLRGETSAKSLEALVKNAGKESMQWGLAAGMYSGLTYGLKEARGTHDWKNSAAAGAITGVALALSTDNSSHEQIVQSAITGAALSTAANLLAGVF